MTVGKMSGDQLLRLYALVVVSITVLTTTGAIGGTEAIAFYAGILLPAPQHLVASRR